MAQVDELIREALMRRSTGADGGVQSPTTTPVLGQMSPGAQVPNVPQVQAQAPNTNAVAGQTVPQQTARPQAEAAGSVAKAAQGGLGAGFDDQTRLAAKKLITEMTKYL